MDNKLKKIVYTGDSTVARNRFRTYPQTGIGQALSLYLADDVEIINLAVNGRSTKSFIDEQRLAQAYFSLREGDFLFIQFGHNDQKKEDPNRYTEPWGDFQMNLEKFVNVARNRKALPVFITPVTRRKFIGNELIPNHGDYPEAMRECGSQWGVPCIDLYKSSMQWVENLGPEASKELYMHVPAHKYEKFPDGLEDDTHLNPYGAKIFAGLLAAGLADLGSPYADLLDASYWS